MLDVIAEIRLSEFRMARGIYPGGNFINATYAAKPGLEIGDDCICPFCQEKPLELKYQRGVVRCHKCGREV